MANFKIIEGFRTSLISLICNNILEIYLKSYYHVWGKFEGQTAGFGAKIEANKINLFFAYFFICKAYVISGTVGNTFVSQHENTGSSCRFVSFIQVELIIIITMINKYKSRTVVLH